MDRYKKITIYMHNTKKYYQFQNSAKRAFFEVEIFDPGKNGCKARPAKLTISKFIQLGKTYAK